MRYLIDTNVILRALDGSQNEQAESSLQLFEKIADEEIQACVTPIILSEVAWTLKSFYNFDKEFIIQALRNLMNLEGLILSNSGDFELAVQIFTELNIKLIDAQIAAIPYVQNNDWTIVSFDQDFDKVPGINWLTPMQLVS